MTRLYARAQRGARIHESAPQGDWKILTILGTMSTRGMIATMTIEEPTDADIFQAYLDHCLCPVLPPPRRCGGDGQPQQSQGEWGAAAD